MRSLTPSAGRIVHYRLTKQQADWINTGRQVFWQTGDLNGAYQGHRGNEAREGDIVPMMIVRVWPHEYGEDVYGVNGQAFLDGSDTLWVTSAKEGEAPGDWSWPPLV